MTTIKITFKDTLSQERLNDLFSTIQAQCEEDELGVSYGNFNITSLQGDDGLGEFNDD